MTGRDVYNAIVTWSQVHTNAAWAIAGLVGGFVLGKVI